MENEDYIRGKVSQSELLAQLAEECCELGQAALKLRRSIDGTNPTRMTREECFDNFIEEFADVDLCMNLVIVPGDLAKIFAIEDEKLARWRKELEEKEK